MLDIYLCSTSREDSSQAMGAVNTLLTHRSIVNDMGRIFGARASWIYTINCLHRSSHSWARRLLGQMRLALLYPILPHNLSCSQGVWVMRMTYSIPRSGPWKGSQLLR